MASLRVCLFGRLKVQRDDRPLDGFDIRKMQELFCYLLLNRDRPQARETLASQLWPDVPTGQSRKCLRQTLWQLQAAVGLEAESNVERVLQIDPDWIQVNTQADLWLDVAVFEQAFAQAQGVAGSSLDTRAVAQLERAAALYQSDLLEGWYQDWCLYDRERLQNIFLAMLNKLMEYCEAHRQYEAGLAYGARILRYDRAHERTHRRLMRLYYLAGDRVAALRQYERCISALEQELDVGPSKRTVTLHKQLQCDQLDELRQASATDPSEVAASKLLSKIHGHLDQVSADLAALQLRVREQIRAVELALREYRSAEQRRP
jgi:DNA-binding SARP family transcriptional activator